MVKNEKDDASEFHPDIVHCGGVGTLRHKLFRSANINLVGMDGKPAGATNNHGLKNFNKEFRQLFLMFEKVIVNNPHQKIKIYTEFRRDKIIYRGDPCSYHCMQETESSLTRSWCDWALFRFDGHNRDGELPSPNPSGVYPGQILGFTNFDTVNLTSSFNKTCTAGDTVETHNGGGYAITEMTERELVGFLDPSSDPMPEQMMQANSRLLFWEQKENIDNMAAAEHGSGDCISKK
jgi:hypothetical protein